MQILNSLLLLIFCISLEKISNDSYGRIQRCIGLANANSQSQFVNWANRFQSINNRAPNLIRTDHLNVNSIRCYWLDPIFVDVMALLSSSLFLARTFSPISLVVVVFAADSFSWLFPSTIFCFVYFFWHTCVWTLLMRTMTTWSTDTHIHTHTQFQAFLQIHGSACIWLLPWKKPNQCESETFECASSVHVRQVYERREEKNTTRNDNEECVRF